LTYCLKFTNVLNYFSYDSHFSYYSYTCHGILAKYYLAAIRRKIISCIVDVKLSVIH